MTCWRVIAQFLDQCGFVAVVEEAKLQSAGSVDRYHEKFCGHLGCIRLLLDGRSELVDIGFQSLYEQLQKHTYLICKATG